MKVKHMLAILNTEQYETRQRFYELEAHQKTLAIELTRVQQDIEKTAKVLDRLGTAIQTVKDADKDG